MTEVEDSPDRQIQGFIVRFNMNGGDTEASPKTMNVVSPATTIDKLPTEPERSGYIFIGWNTRRDGDGEIFFQERPITANITVYAQWKELPPGSHIVTFDANIGAGQEKLHYEDAYPRRKAVISPNGTVGSLPEDPVLAGHKFIGWNLNNDGSGTAFSGGTPVAASITVYAQWEIIEYTVTFDSNRGNKAADPRQKILSWPELQLGTLDSPPERIGYTFNGWNSKADGSGPVYTDSSIIESDIVLYAQWASYNYTVSFNKNGGDTEARPAERTVTSPDTTVGKLPAEPARNGFVFTGWNKKIDGLGENFTASTAVTGNHTVYAQWRALPSNYFRVTFNRNGGDREASPNTKPVIPPEDTVDSLPAEPAKTGYKFNGWNTAADGTGSPFTENVAVTGDITVYAQWAPYSYKVTFNNNGGDTEANPGEITVNSPFIKPDSLPLQPIRNGFAFVEWNTEADGTGIAFTGETAVTGDITVYAQWRELPPDSHIVSFDKNGGNREADPQTLAVVSPAVNTGGLPVAPAKTGYHFAGWNTKADGTGTAFTGETAVTAGITVYAQWSSYTYTVTFNQNGGNTAANPPTKTVSSPAANIDGLPAAPVRTGYSFDGWNINADGSHQTPFDEKTPVTANVTVYAQWKPIHYTVSYNANGGDGTMQSSSRTYDDGMPLPFCTFFRTGYQFTGWNTESGGGGISYADRASSNLSSTDGASIQLYAQWAEKRYTVKFNADGGTPVPATQEVSLGGKVSEPAAMSRTGSTFMGWYGDARFSTRWNFAVDTVTDDITLYAKWDVVRYTVTYNANGGDTAPGARTVPAGSDIILPSSGDISRQGYRLTGWTITDDGSGTMYNPGASYTVVNNVILYAQWKVSSQYTVSFNINNGSGTTPGSITGYEDSRITLPDGNGLSKTGYHFAGWTVSSDGSGTVYPGGGSYTIPGNDVTLYAKWVHRYTVTYNANGGNGTVPAIQSADEGSRLQLHSGNGLTKINHRFKGWNTAANGTETTYNANTYYTITENLTLYAQWIEQYTVTYNANGGSGTVSPQTVDAGSSVTVSDGSRLSRSGYTFIGWNTNPNGDGTDYSPGGSYPITGSISLHAQWETLPVYTISFNINNGSGTTPDPKTGYENDTIILPGNNDFSKTGHRFTGWNTSETGSGTSYNANSLYTINSNITLYAEWETNTYTVTYNANNGSGTVPSTETVNAGSFVTVSDGSGLSRIGYTFTGWNTNAYGIGTDYNPGDTFTPNSNTTLYAQWNQQEVKVTVTFQLREGTWPDGTKTDKVMELMYGDTVNNFPENPVWPGYQFAAWIYVDSPISHIPDVPFFDFMPVTESITVYAKWNKSE